MADGRGGEDTQSFLLPVASSGSVINQPPTISSSPRTSVGLETLYTYFVQASDPNHDPLTFSLDEPPPGMDIDQAGVVSWTPAANQLGDHPVTVRVEDGRGGFATQRFAIGVAQQTTNSPPTITSVPPFTAQVDQSYEYNALAVDPDNDPVVWSLLSGPDGLSIDALRGGLRWTPGGAQIGFHEVIIQATDTQGASGIQGFGLNVSGTNSPPVVSSAPPTLAFAGDSYFYPVRAVDANNDPLGFSLTTGPDGMTIGNTTGLIQWTPTTNQTGTHNVVFRVEDGRGGVGEQGFTLSVSGDGPNGPPVITSTPEFVATVDQTYQYQIDATDPEGLSLTYQRIDGPTGMIVNPAAGLVTWTPTLDQLGANVVQLAAFDPLDLGASQTFTITVREDNRPPALDNTPTTTAVAGKLYAFDMNVTDPDDDAKIFTLTGGPEGMTLDELGRLRWTPTLDDEGVHRVDVTIRDDRGLGITFGFDLTVVVDTAPPEVIVNVNTNPAGIGQDVTFWVAATDNIAIESIGLEIDGAPVALDGSGAATLSFDAFGVVEAVATATDSSGNTAQASLQLSVINTSDVDAPVVEITSPEFDQVITAPIDVIGTVSDTDGLLNYKLELAAVDAVFEEIGGGATEVIDGVLGQIDPTLLENDSYILRLTAEDAGGNIAATESLFSVAGALKVGNFTLSFVDLSIPVQGIPIVVGRTYDSLAANRSGDFGFGWRLGLFDVDLRDNVPRSGLEDVGIFNPYRNGTRIYLRLPDGSREAFTVRPKVIDNSIAAGLLFTIANYVTVEFVPDPGVTSRLELSRNFTLHLTDAGELINPNGLPFNPASSLFRPVNFTLTTKEGIAFQIDPVSGALDHITDRNGNRLTVDADGVSSTTGRNVEFRRDPQGRITAVVDPMGNSINYDYDANGDLVTVTDREGYTTRFIYSNERPHFLEEITDPLGRTGARSEYNDAGRLVRIIDVNGNSTELIHDIDNAVETIKDIFGNDSVFVYDTRGNILQEINAETEVTRHTYDANDNELSRTVVLQDGAELNTTFTYDSRGNQTSVTNPLGKVSRTTYNSFGDPLVQTDPTGNTITHVYDARGNRSAIAGQPVGVITFAHDTNGNLTSLTQGSVSETLFEYDAVGNLSRQVDPDEQVRTATHDANGRMLTSTIVVSTAAGPHTFIERKEYDAEGRTITTTNAEDHKTRFEYDAAGNLKAVIDALKHRTEFRYDDRGLLTETILADDTPLDLTDNPRTRSEYDEAARETAAIDEVGRRTEFVYDMVGRLVEVILPDDTPGNLADNPRRITEYDAAGRVVAEVDEFGNRTEAKYDDAGRIILTRNALKQETTTAYDDAGRVTAETDALLRTTRFAYDSEGRLVETRFADGSTAELEVDAMGRPTSRIDQNGKITRYEYDDSTRLTAIVDALHQRTQYEYDEANNLVRQIDANGHVTQSEFDGLGRRTATELPLGQRSTTVYDAVGNVQSTTDFNDDTVTYEYDVRNRLETKRYPDGASVEFTYTAAGQLETVTDARGVTSYKYDERGRLVSRTDPASPTDPNGPQISYAYGTVDNWTSVTTPSGTTTYTFDALNRLETVTDPDSGILKYEYDEVGNLDRTTLPNNTRQTLEYNELNRLVFLENIGPEGVINSFRYTLDDVGNRTNVVEDTGREVTYTYDELYRLLGEDITDSANGNRTIDYTYDDVGNRLTRDDSVKGLTDYKYNDNDHLLTETLAGDTTRYEYDENGNRLRRIDDTTDQVLSQWHWDFGNRLIAADTDGDGAVDVENEYDGHGIRVAQTVDGEETRFLIDANRPFAQVLEEYTPGGIIKVSYVYGNDLISQDRDGNRSFYHVDGIGSTRSLTGEGGEVTDRYTYDAFGRLIIQTGSTDNLYLFQGEQFDPHVAQYYLRQRYYDLATGRFTSADPFAGFIESPTSLHRFLFANANPVNNVDPSGELTLAGTITMMEIQQDLQMAFTLAAFDLLVRAEKIADNLLIPARSFQDVGMALLMHGAGELGVGGVSLYQAGRTLMVLGLKGLNLASAHFYADAIRHFAFMRVSKAAGKAIDASGLGDAGIFVLKMFESRATDKAKKHIGFGGDVDKLVDVYIMKSRELVNVRDFEQLIENAQTNEFKVKANDVKFWGKMWIKAVKGDFPGMVIDLEEEYLEPLILD